MKRITLLSLLLSFCLVSLAYAVPRENCGCGLGSLLMQEKEGLAFEVMAATTNGTSGNQTFGMSSGTLGCKKPAKIVYLEHLQNFIADNMDQLAIDIASGNGETLEALSEVAGVPNEKRTVFFGLLQENFTQIYPNAEVKNSEIANQISAIANLI